LKEEKKQRELEKLKGKAKQTEMMKFIDQEYGDKPEEDNNDIFQSVDKEFLERQRIEEDMFIRTNLSKKEKAKQEKRKQFKNDTLEDLASFRQIAAIEGNGNNPENLLKKINETNN